MPRDPLNTALANAIAERVAAGHWTVVALAGDKALTPIADFLREQFGIESVNGTVIAVVRCEATDA